MYFVPSPDVLNSTTTTLGSNIPLVNGVATVTTSALTADKHFITASYSGGGGFSARQFGARSSSPRQRVVHRADIFS